MLAGGEARDSGAEGKPVTVGLPRNANRSLQVVLGGFRCVGM